jgi:hypothetical protein
VRKHWESGREQKVDANGLQGTTLTRAPSLRRTGPPLRIRVRPRASLGSNDAKVTRLRVGASEPG